VQDLRHGDRARHIRFERSPNTLVVLVLVVALPVAATVMMLIEELRVELPGEQGQPVDTFLREADDRGEEEYERRTEGCLILGPVVVL
jgi:hypothetical protein